MQRDSKGVAMRDWVWMETLAEAVLSRRITRALGQQLVRILPQKAII